MGIHIGIHLLSGIGRMTMTNEWTPITINDPNTPKEYYEGRIFLKIPIEKLIFNTRHEFITWLHQFLNDGNDEIYDIYKLQSTRYGKTVRTGNEWIIECKINQLKQKFADNPAVLEAINMVLTFS